MSDLHYTDSGLTMSSQDDAELDNSVSSFHSDTIDSQDLDPDLPLRMQKWNPGQFGSQEICSEVGKIFEQLIKRYETINKRRFYRWIPFIG
jgi:hypothetical protein